MAKHIKHPKKIKAAGNKPKVIDEFIGRINSDTEDISIARMKSPGDGESPARHLNLMSIRPCSKAY